MSCKFGEFIKKTIFIVKMSQAKPLYIESPPPQLSAKRQVARVDFPRVEGKCASWRRRGKSPLGGGRVGWSADWYHSITDHQFCAQFNMKMDNDVLLLCYIDKIRLTGNLWRALASLYSEARLYKGPRTATRPQLTTLHSTGNISVWTKEVSHSNTRGTVRLCSFQLKLTAAQ